jgi:uncharacterized protein YjbI with pentapeptide repeats
MTVHPSCRDPEDPSELAKPSLPGNPCATLAHAEWTSQERWAWEQICEGRVADFNKVARKKVRLDPKKSDGWTEKRILRQVFLETILLYEPWREKIPRQGIRISGAWFKEPLNLSQAEVKHALMLHCSRFDAQVNLLSLHTTRYLLLTGSVLTGDLIMSGIHVEGSLFLEDAQFTNIRLRGAHIRDQLSLINTKVTGMLNMDSLEVGNSLLNGAHLEHVRLHETHVDGQLSLKDTTVNGWLVIGSSSIESDLILRQEEPCAEQHIHFTNVYLLGVRVGGSLDLSCSIVTGMLKINSSEVKETLDLSGALLPSLDLTGSHIGGELRLSRGVGMTKWQSTKAILTLRNVTAGAIQDTHNAWPNILVLDGFTYGRLSGFTGHETHNAMNQRDVAWFIKWLSKQGMYSSQPYEHLAKILREEGRQDDAKEILFAGKERERSMACRSKNPKKSDVCVRSKLPWLGLSISWALTGYGYYPFKALIWAGVATVFGMLVLKCTGQAKEHKMKYWGLSYSLAMLLPIIDLYRYRSNKIDLGGFAQVYFYCHHIFGYALAIFLGAALTGLTK